MGAAVPETRRSASLVVKPTTANAGKQMAAVRSKLETSLHTHAVAHVSHAGVSALASAWKENANPASSIAIAANAETAMRIDDDGVRILRTS